MTTKDSTPENNEAVVVKILWQTQTVFSRPEPQLSEFSTCPNNQPTCTTLLKLSKWELNGTFTELFFVSSARFNPVT